MLPLRYQKRPGVQPAAVETGGTVNLMWPIMKPKKVQESKKERKKEEKQDFEVISYKRARHIDCVIFFSLHKFAHYY